MGCPNTTAGGCRCVEHHPGLGYQGAPDPVVLHVVTAEPVEPCDQQADIEQLIRAARAHCPACNGNPARCQQGTGSPRYARLPNCRAWADNGLPNAQRATPHPRQPWEPRPSRRAA